ncbi:MAG: hypothetical protein ACRERV_16660, partial [Methylococcales bacterium]
MQPFEFSSGIKGSEIIKKPDRKSPAQTSDYFVTPETIPGKLLSSRARFRFVSGFNRKLTSGLNKKCKLIGGLTIKKCQLFSGRVSVLFFFEKW